MSNHKTHTSTVIFWIRGVFLFVLIMGRQRFFADGAPFLLDYVPTPLYTRYRSFQKTQPIIRIMHDALIRAIGHIWGSKLYLGIILILSLLLGYKRGAWVNTVFHSEGVKKQGVILIAMLAFVANPFMSGRFGTQPGIRLGTILLGWGIRKIITQRSSFDRKAMLFVACSWALAMSSMPHASFMILLLLITFIVLRWKEKKIWMYALSIGLIVLIVNSNWLLQTKQIIETTGAFDMQTIHAFASSEHSSVGPLLTALLGYGFWGEMTGSGFAPTYANERWRVAGVLLLIFAGVGTIPLYKKKQYKQLGRLLIVGIIALSLGVGVASKLTAPLTEWLYDSVPLYRGLREPHKWIGVWMMVLLPLMILGICSGVEYTKRWIQSWVSLSICGLVFVARTPGVFMAMKGRFIPTDYPVSYQSTRDFLMQGSINDIWVHLPWHSYQQCDRTNKVVANSLAKFFAPVTVITADNIEIGSVYTHSTSQRSKDIEAFLQTRDLDLLKKQGITGILFTTTCADYKNYERLSSVSGLELFSKAEGILLYRFK